VLLAHRGPHAPDVSVRRAAGPFCAGSLSLPAAALFAGLAACGRTTDASAADTAGGKRLPDTPAVAAPAAPLQGVSLVEVAGPLGIDFVHDNGAAGAYHLPEVMVGGVAVFDYDGDQRLDLYFVQSGERVPPRSEAASNAPDRLYHQESDGTFRDVTTAAGLGDRGYGMGAAVGDVDNDGDLDLFVTNYGPDTLYRNDGDGTFSDVTAVSGLGDPGWSASAVFCDVDLDGWLDLYVTRYVDFDSKRECAQQGGRRDYCGPTVFPGVHDLLYRNTGGGRFVDRSREAGITTVEDAGLGVVCDDFDDDGWPDLYVANDADPNNLWINQRDGTFVDEAVLYGAAFNRLGVAEAGMGVAAADADGDGDLDLLVTNLIEETNTYYRNLGAAGFEDGTAASGLALGSMDRTGFGVVWFDLENDGDLDTAVSNGAVKRRPSPWSGGPDGFWSDYAEPNLLYTNSGDGAFAATAAVPFTGAPAVSRSLVAADLDADGDLELVTTTLDGPARVYRNDGGNAASWIAIDVIDPALRRHAIGARVTVEAGGRRLVRHASAAGSYLAGTGAQIHLGLGSIEEIDGFLVRWPGGVEERFSGGPARRRVTLRRGEGRRAGAEQ
jgi:hypothetical protein